MEGQRDGNKMNEKYKGFNFCRTVGRRGEWRSGKKTYFTRKHSALSHLVLLSRQKLRHSLYFVRVPFVGSVWNSETVTFPHVIGASASHWKFTEHLFHIEWWQWIHGRATGMVAMSCSNRYGTNSRQTAKFNCPLCANVHRDFMKSRRSSSGPKRNGEQAAATIETLITKTWKCVTNIPHVLRWPTAVQRLRGKSRSYASRGIRTWRSTTPCREKSRRQNAIDYQRSIFMQASSKL